MPQHFGPHVTAQLVQLMGSPLVAQIVGGMGPQLTGRLVQVSVCSGCEGAARLEGERGRSGQPLPIPPIL